MDGILVIDKPKDMTSHDVVNIARRALGTQRIGHTGTLDPNATGVLVLAIGKVTKLVKYFTNDNKTYECTFVIGQEYDTDDVTGKLTNELDASKINKDKIIEVLNSFVGKQRQTPPAFSAIKVQGRKLYELARRDLDTPDVEPRDVEVYDISNISVKYLEKTIEVEATFEVSKGTYIRSIAKDLGQRLGNFGCLAELRRTKVNKFLLSDAVTIDQLKNKEVILKDPFDYLDLPRITVDEVIQNDINYGRFIELDFFPVKTDTIIFNASGEPLAIYYYDEDKNIMRMSVKWC